MPFTNTWDAAFEAIPADSEDINLGANRIRYLKVAIRERMQVDHIWEDAQEDGKHQKLTLVPLSVVPAAASPAAFLFAMTVAGFTELFYEDSAGNLMQLTQGGVLYPFSTGDFSIGADLAVASNATVGEALSFGVNHVTGFAAFADPTLGDTYYQFATGTYFVRVQATGQVHLFIGGVAVQTWG